uniref:Phospholipid scramblase n=1 Tax=Leptobrachium leishanense TaxID=445787 RepID=A0A8C5P8M6_9ANUR
MDPPAQTLYSGPHDAPSIYSNVAVPMDTMVKKGVPRSLEHLLQLNQLAVRQKFSVSQGNGRTFDILDPAGQRVYQALQEYQCCGPGYNVKIMDNSEQEVLDIIEECACTCTRQVQVHSFGGNLLGNVKLHSNFLVTHLSVMDPSKNVVLHIVGPSFKTNIFGDCSFEVKSSDEQHVVGMFKNESDFLVSFPMDLDVSVKALLLGACFFLESCINTHRVFLTNRKYY